MRLLARSAAIADVAATLIANAVNIDSPAVLRRPARALDPDSDLRDHAVTVSVGALTLAEIDAALMRGLARADDFCRRDLIADACLTLAGQTRALCGPLSLSPLFSGERVGVRGRALLRSGV
jgi:hypothetical protein